MKHLKMPRTCKQCGRVMHRISRWLRDSKVWICRDRNCGYSVARAKPRAPEKIKALCQAKQRESFN